MKYLFICLLSVPFFFSCKKNNDVQKNTTIEMGTCKTLDLQNSPLICFDSLMADSRCPSDVMCGTAGFAVVRLRIKIDDTAQSFSLSTLTNGSGALPTNDTIMTGHRIKLVDVSPYPNLSSPSPDRPGVTLQVSF